ncbi:uncharacterized protein LOC141698779 [Apium graveolens]|uniref:uncharacterized protein LOC141698779 n=1 Tax=Apium graveolens TaxID=4045 RepID=UPI003D79CBE5
MGGGGVGQAVKRIPLIKFPQRHAHKPTSSTSPVWRSDISTAPMNTASGGKASLQPKRTPVTDREIEAILLGGTF